MEPHEYEQMYRLEERHWWYRALRRQILRTLRAEGLLDARHPGRRCLDAGCGTGRNLALLAPHFDCVGFDYSAEALHLALSRQTAPLWRASTEQIPLPDACCDLILSCDVLYHRGVRNDLAALIELHRCLRPGGYLLVNLPAFSWLRSAHDRAIHTVRRYTRGEVIAKLERAGLDPRQVRYWNWMLFPPLAAVRLVRALGTGENEQGRSARDRSAQDRSARGQDDQPGESPSRSSSDLTALPAPLNWALDRLLAIEATLGSARVLPGLSIMALARRPEA